MKKLTATLLVGAILGLGFAFSESDAALKATAFSGGTVSTAILGPDSTACATPPYSFSSEANTGFAYQSVGSIRVCNANTEGTRLTSGGIQTVSQISLGATIAAQDTVLARDGAADILAMKRSSNAQTQRWYATTTGPIYLALTARAAGGAVLTGTGAPMQLSTVQTTAPTCSSNCGTSPSITGTDTAGTVTMGASGVPASGWVVTFNGTWASAPACVVQMALAGMVVGKQPLTVATTTTTITVVTNGTAPATSDKYHFHCVGIS